MKGIIRIFVVVLALLLPATALAANPETWIKDKHAELTPLLKKKSAQNDQKIEAIFDEILDYDTLARESLGDQWEGRSDTERKDFQALLKQLVQKAYRENLRKTLDYDIEYHGDAKAKDGSLVRTVAHNRKNSREEPISIDYLVHEVAGQPRIRDIITEGSSLVGTYRSQFRRIIKKEGFDGLIKRMKAKRDKG